MSKISNTWKVDEFVTSLMYPVSLCHVEHGGECIWKCTTESTGQVLILEDAMLQHCPQKAEP